MPPTYKIGLNNQMVPPPTVQEKSSAFVAAKTIKTILDENDPDWDELGQWDSLGVIKWIPMYNDSQNQNTINIAKPLFSNIKQFPLKGEIVYVVQLPNPQTNEENTSSWYYITVVNIWNHPHHNALPTEDNSDNIALGKTFTERDIKPLLPFEGDIIYEGRWGQSIRFGSTVKDENPWSTFGNNGDPITIIRNGQSSQKDKDKGWVPTVEDINEDGSSIYIAQGQNIPLKVSSTNLKSFGTSSLEPVDKFSGNQFIFNSDRVVINSKQDNILMFGKKNLGISVNEAINFDSKTYVVNSTKIQLGLNANQPLLLGTDTIDMLKEVFEKLDKLSGELGNMVFYDGNQKIASTPVNTMAFELQASLKEIRPKLDNLKSKSNYTV